LGLDEEAKHNKINLRNKMLKDTIRKLSLLLEEHPCYSASLSCELWRVSINSFSTHVRQPFA